MPSGRQRAEGHSGPAPHIVYVVTSPFTAVTLLREQLAFLCETGLRITLVCSPGAALAAFGADERIRVETIPMEREIAILKDAAAAWRLFRLFRRLRPNLINASTPKAGLLGLVAARFARVPHRVYLLRGLRLETAEGLRRKVLAWSERIASFCATRVLAVSESLAARYSELSLGPLAKLAVLGNGSSNGVDLDRFGGARNTQALPALQKELGFAEDQPVVGFVGRLTNDKGIQDLLAVFDRILADIPQARLLLVGDFETGDPIPDATRKRITEDGRVSRTGMVTDTAPYYALMSVLAFPSYREGLPNAPLEAAAAAVPTVGFRTTGVVDTIEDGRTGRLVGCADAAAMADAVLHYLRHPDLRRQHGAAARGRVERLFEQTTVWKRYLKEYRRLLSGKPAATE